MHYGAMRILVTTDGSPQSLLALPHADRFADATGWDISLCRVLDTRVDAAGEVATQLSVAVENVSERWQRELEAVLAEHGIEGSYAVTVKGRDEEVVAAIVRAAAESGAGMIAMATRGAGAVRRALLGSISLATLGQSPVPMMMTGPAIQPPNRREPYKVLATTDGSQASLSVLHLLGELLPASAKVTLLRVCLETGLAGNEQFEACRRELADARRILPAEMDVEPVIRRVEMPGWPEREILDVTREVEADAIAMSTQGHSAARHVILGSVAMKVLGSAPVPVILARSEVR